MKQTTNRAAAADNAGWIVAQHGEHFTRHDGFDDAFSPLVASTVTSFFEGQNGERERVWIAQVGDGRV